MAKCVKYARYFLNVMLTLLRENAQERRIKVTEEFQNVPKWLNSFLSVCYGMSFFNYALPLREDWQNVNIAYIDMINILVALKVWHIQWAGLKVLIN